MEGSTAGRRPGAPAPAETDAETRPDPDAPAAPPAQEAGTTPAAGTTPEAGDRADPRPESGRTPPKAQDGTAGGAADRTATGKGSMGKGGAGKAGMGKGATGKGGAGKGPDGKGGGRGNPGAPGRKPNPSDAAILAQARAELERGADADRPAPRTVATRKRRHWMVLTSFVLVVVLPTLAAAWYLYDRAVDQYASVMAFSVRSEEGRSAFDMIGQIGGGFGFGGGAASTDGEILYQFIQSQELVATIDAELDLRELFARHHDTDPVFGFRPDGTIEDLTDHWARKLRIAFDTGTGLMEIRVLAFDPHEAQAIARAILEQSTERINELSAAAREDATRWAREDLDLALERLRAAREAVTEFRTRTQIVDPTADLQGQMGLLNTLQGQLAEALIELDLLRETTRESDPRILQQQRRIEVIRTRIAEERARLGGGTGPAGDDYATVVAEFERLNLDREFAEQTYGSALSALDAAVAQAQRNSRYLATHILPTLAESPRYPEREKLLGLTAFFLILGWAVAALIYYSVRDSR